MSFSGVSARDLTLTQQTNVYRKVVTLFGVGIRPEDRLVEDAHQIAPLVRKKESIALAQLLHDTGEAQPAELTFVQPELQYWRTAGGAVSGALSQVAAYFDTLRAPRMAIVGSPGSGKSVLLVRLVRDLAARIAEATPRPGARFAVPVLLNAQAFPLGPDRLSPGQVSARLEAWLVRELQSVYGVGIRQSERLVAGGWILPVLDGLDEMDPPGEPPLRAADLVAGLNHPTGAGLRGVVLSCRAQTYDQLVALAEVEEADAVLEDCTVVETEPLATGSARTYLAARFPDPASRAVAAPRWRALLDRDDPPDTPWVAALRSPLRLFLIATGYQHPDTDPVELAAFTDTDALDDHLFSLLVDAKVRQHPQSFFDPSSFRPGRWLQFVAKHLEGAGGYAVELRLSEISALAGERRAHRIAAVTSTLLISAVWIGCALWVGFRPSTGVADLILYGAILLSYTSTVIGLLGRPDFKRFDVQSLTTRIGRRRLRRAVPSMLVCGLIGAVLGGVMTPIASHLVSTYGFVVAFVVFGTQGVIYGALVTVRGNVLPASRPRAVVRQAVAHLCLFSGLYVLLIFAMLSSLAYLLDGTYPSELVLTFAVFSLVFGAVADLGWSAVPPYLVACLLLARRRQMPRRVAVFLDWASEAGLLRLTGESVQFRHREFQAWLAATSPSRPGNVLDPAR